MLSAKNALLLGLLGLGFTACTAGNGLTGADKKTGGEKEEDEGEEEEDDADPPQEISGAYLTTCGEAPELPADAGMKTLACSVKEDDVKVEVTSPAVKCNYSDGSSDSPEVKAEPSASVWNFSFQVPQAKFALLASVNASYTQDGKVVEVTKKADELKSTLPKQLDTSLILAFTTKAKFSTAGTMPFDGVSGADAACQSSGAKFGGSWRAIISADGSYPELKLDRTVKSAAKGDLPTFHVGNFWDEAHVLFAFDEEGDPIPQEDYVWTGIVASAEELPETCAQWTDEEGKRGIISNPFQYDWLTSGAVDDCNQNQHLYCIQQY